VFSLARISVWPIRIIKIHQTAIDAYIAADILPAGGFYMLRVIALFAGPRVRNSGFGLHLATAHTGL